MELLSQAEIDKLLASIEAEEQQSQDKKEANVVLNQKYSGLENKPLSNIFEYCRHCLMSSRFVNGKCHNCMKILNQATPTFHNKILKKENL